MSSPHRVLAAFSLLFLCIRCAPLPADARLYEGCALDPEHQGTWACGAVGACLSPRAAESADRLCVAPCPVAPDDPPCPTRPDAPRAGVTCAIFGAFRGCFATCGGASDPPCPAFTRCARSDDGLAVCVP